MLIFEFPNSYFRIMTKQVLLNVSTFSKNEFIEDSWRNICLGESDEMFEKYLSRNAIVRRAIVVVANFFLEIFRRFTVLAHFPTIVLHKSPKKCKLALHSSSYFTLHPTRRLFTENLFFILTPHFLIAISLSLSRPPYCITTFING